MKERNLLEKIGLFELCVCIYILLGLILLQRLYELGARKFVVTGVGAIGCCPVQRLKNTTNGCMEKTNNWSMEYNKGLQIMLKELKLESSDINYSYFDIFGVMSDLIQDPQNYGTFY